VIEKQENSKKKENCIVKSKWKRTEENVKRRRKKKEEYKNGRIKAKSDVSKKETLYETKELWRNRRAGKGARKNKNGGKGKSYVMRECKCSFTLDKRRSKTREISKE